MFSFNIESSQKNHYRLLDFYIYLVGLLAWVCSSMTKKLANRLTSKEELALHFSLLLLQWSTWMVLVNGRLWCSVTIWLLMFKCWVTKTYQNIFVRLHLTQQGLPSQQLKGQKSLHSSNSFVLKRFVEPLPCVWNSAVPKALSLLYLCNLVAWALP